MSDATAQAEPSMEEILASIRRIISEDEPEEGATPEAASAPAPEATSKPEPEAESQPEPEPEPEPNGEVLELTQKVNEDGSITDLNETPEEEAADVADVLADAFPDTPAPEAEAEPEAEPDPEPAPEAPDSDTDGEGLVSDPVAAAATGSFSELARAMDASRIDSMIQIGDGRTLEQIVREALMPELKAWLDTNLNALVEQIVREEIKRLVRRAEDQ